MLYDFFNFNTIKYSCLKENTIKYIIFVYVIENHSIIFLRGQHFIFNGDKPKVTQ